MHLRASGDGGKLFLETDEANHRAVSFEPCSSPARTPTPVAGGLIGNGEGGGEQILD
jgi:hypothetical protein